MTSRSATDTTICLACPASDEVIIRARFLPYPIGFLAWRLNTTTGHIRRVWAKAAAKDAGCKLKRPRPIPFAKVIALALRGSVQP